MEWTFLDQDSAKDIREKVVRNMRLHSGSADEREHTAQQIKSIADQEPHLLDQEQLTAELGRLRRLNDSKACRLLEAVLSKVKASPQREWYRYSF
jgi:hypothetical protein